MGQSLSTCPLMTATAQPQPRTRRRLDLVDVTLLVAGLTQLLPGLLAFFAPGAFYDLIATYPPENAHFAKDIGSWQIPLGLAALAAIGRPALRPFMLGVLALQYALHAVSHAIDVDLAEPASMGWVTLVALVLGAVLVGGLAAREARR